MPMGEYQPCSRAPRTYTWVRFTPPGHPHLAGSRSRITVKDPQTTKGHMQGIHPEHLGTNN